MKTEIENGSLTLGERYGWRIQFYWPEIHCGRTLFFVDLGTAFRIEHRKDKRGEYAAFGLQLLGFGFGVSYFKNFNAEE